jgi:dihydrofolate reductase
MKRDPATKEATVGKVVVTEFISLDGVIEAPGDPTEYERGGWATGGGQEGMQFKFDELIASDVQLLGRITYEGFAKAWPTMEGTGEFGEKMNEMPKFVVSTTLRDPQWNNTTVLNGDLGADVDELTKRFNGDVLVAGSGKLVQALLELDLVDELRLMVFPIVLGKGKRLFGETSEKKQLALVDSKTLDGGVIILTYAPA